MKPCDLYHKMRMFCHIIRANVRFAGAVDTRAMCAVVLNPSSLWRFTLGLYNVLFSMRAYHAEDREEARL